MDSPRLALGLLLLACLALSTVALPRGLLQGRSGRAPGRVDEPEIPRGQPEDVVAVGAQLQGPNAPKFLMPGAASELVKDTFIVQTAGAPATDIEAIMGSVRGRAIQVTDLNGPAFQGFAVQLPPGLAQQSALLQELIDTAAVTLVESDIIVQAVQTPVTQTSATWGLDRIDQLSLPLNGQYTYTDDATGVIAYIIDTGITVGHREFLRPDGTSRASLHKDFTRTKTPRAGDCNGHGTHVAGTVGGNTYGVAKDVTLVGMRVFDCRGGSGTTTSIIDAVNTAVTHCNKRKCVINMSLGGGFSASFTTAVRGATNAGVVVVVAAGNENRDACGTSPASEPTAITVGATTSSDIRADFSNFGSCVDIFAPGNSITSAWYTSTTATAILGGTSMASPHVAGVMALHLSTLPAAPANGADVAAAAQAVFAKAQLDRIAGAQTTPNRMLYWAPV